MKRINEAFDSNS